MDKKELESILEKEYNLKKVVTTPPLFEEAKEALIKAAFEVYERAIKVELKSIVQNILPPNPFSSLCKLNYLRGM